MTHPTHIRACPLCGSEKFSLHEPDAEQVSTGAICILKCECGATIAFYPQPKGTAPPTAEEGR